MRVGCCKGLSPETRAPRHSVKDLIALAKTRSPPLGFASAGNGTSSHLAAERLRTNTGINLLHIPYKSIATALVDVMGGEVSLMFLSLVTGLPHVRSGKVKALASTDARRSLPHRSCRR